MHCWLAKNVHLLVLCLTFGPKGLLCFSFVDKATLVSFGSITNPANQKDIFDIQNSIVYFMRWYGRVVYIYIICPKTYLLLQNLVFKVQVNVLLLTNELLFVHFKKR